ncbi:hypothetical protein KIN20_020184 [Parelaphostrongylus tenuis]|uniref:Uncharacterized protein n=1 Tax=Parelaphostrongylus tenuis TaxID=148309 RepID=A0AAD5QVF7_PARTN|nr:hypothetical protein KIN20_020184 [Parelaphostrongylus tenuis]
MEVIFLKHMKNMSLFVRPLRKGRRSAQKKRLLCLIVLFMCSISAYIAFHLDYRCIHEEVIKTDSSTMLADEFCFYHLRFRRIFAIKK